MKRTRGTFWIVLGGILLIVGGVLFWQQHHAEAPAVRQESSEAVDPQEEVATPAGEEARSQELEETRPLPTTSSEAEPKTQASISTADCEDECSAYTEPEVLRYCRVLCGLETPTYQDKDCENVGISEKDFCYKEEAVRTQDAEMCAKIKDVKLRKTCEARVAEDLF